MHIVIKRHTEQMKGWQAQAQRFYGDKYDSTVGPYKSLLEGFCRKERVSATEGAIGLIDYLRMHPKMKARFGSQDKAGKHLKAILFSAALELIEGRSDVAG